MKYLINIIFLYINLNAFEITPYKENYIQYNDNKEQYKSYRYGMKYKNIELEFQLSGKIKIYNLQNYTNYISYTQTSYWQIFTPGSPFREHNYNPELINEYSFNIFDESILKLNINIGHKSNGETNIPIEEDNMLKESDIEIDRLKTRSFNYIDSKIGFNNKKFLFNLTYKTYINVENQLQNPDIEKYNGNIEINVKRKFNDFILNINNKFYLNENEIKLTSNEIKLEYNIYDSSYIYIKYFNGYSDSLIDYKDNISKISYGINLFNIF